MQLLSGFHDTFLAKIDRTQELHLKVQVESLKLAARNLGAEIMRPSAISLKLRKAWNAVPAWIVRQPLLRKQDVPKHGTTVEPLRSYTITSLVVRQPISRHVKMSGGLDHAAPA